MENHLVSHIKNPHLKSDNTLHVIGVIQNPVRYHSRYRLFRNWAKEMVNTPNVQLHVVEAVYKNRHQECAPDGPADYNYMAVETHSEIWLKENLINLAVEYLLPKHWNALCWSDTDIHFRRNDWALATLHQLQHFNIVQPWRSASDLDFYGNVMDAWTSFGSLVARGERMYKDKSKVDEGYKYAHTGYAWACNRYFYKNIERLMDFNIVGAGDHAMAWACLGMVDNTMPRAISCGYRKMCEDWQRKALRACAGMVGYVPGRIEHHYHGAKKKRQYWERWDILTKNNYDPATDLAYDSQGVRVLCGRNKWAIERGVMSYNRKRHEDDIGD